MGEVFLFSKCIDDKGVNAFQFRNFLRCYIVGICNIGQRTDAVAKNRKVFMHSLNGDDVNTRSLKWRFFHKMEVGFRQAGILVMGKYIGIITHERLACFCVEVDVHFAILHIVERADIVKSSHVVTMGMSNQNCIQMANIMAQHLLTEIGTDIEKNILLVNL